MENTLLANDWVQWGAFVGSLTAARVATLLYCQSVSHSSEAAKKKRITERPVINDKQNRKESVWPIGFALDFVVLMAVYAVGCLADMAVWDIRGVLCQLIIHCTFVEFVYYWLHRALHSQWLYKNVHSYHHASVNTQPTTALSFEIGERLAYTALFSVTPIATYYLGYQSYLTLAMHLLWFDLNNAMGHCNFEIMPRWFMESPFALVWYTPSYHSIHHTRFKRNYALFMPWTDLVFGTADMAKTRDVMHAAIDRHENLLQRVSKYDNHKVMEHGTFEPKDFAFVAHGLDVYSFNCVEKVNPFTGANFHGKRYDPKWYDYRWLPFAFCHYVWSSYFSSIPYLIDGEFHRDINVAEGGKRRLRGSTYVLRNAAYDYFVPWKYKTLNERVALAVLDAQRRNTRVVGLAALNKAEWLNHGGVDTLELIKDYLKPGTWITHGDTLTAAAVLHLILDLRDRNFWRRDVFMIGATSKIGRALSLGLVRRGIPVRMFTASQERFEYIQREAGTDGHLLTRSSDLADGASCDLWVTGKYKPQGKELLDALPRNVTVCNFAVPDPLNAKILRARPDVLHLDGGYLAFDPNDTNMKFTHLLPAGIMYACMAGCVVHAAMGLEEHEIGPVDMDRLDLTWNKAMEYGFTLPPPTSFNKPVDVPERRFEEV